MDAGPSPLRDAEILRKAHDIAKRQKDAIENKGKKAKSYKAIVKALRAVLPEQAVTDKIGKIKQEVRGEGVCRNHQQKPWRIVVR